MEEFEQLADQYAPMINSIIRSLHIYKNREEFYQVGLIALWESAKRFDANKGHFNGFAYRTIKGRMMEELTRINKIQETAVEPNDLFWENSRDGYTENPFPYEQLLSYCTGMTPNQKKWVIYTFMDLLSVKEIAEKENVSVSAVKSWRAGAKRHLKAELK